MADKEEFSGLKINPVHNPTPEIGIDTEKTLINNIIGAAQVGGLDVAAIESLTASAQTREQTYQLLDSMAVDDVVAAVLETYAEDVVQTNDKGQVIWVESEDSQVLDYTTWLMDSLNVDKHVYQWAYCLVTYGDVYLRLYRKSDVEEDKLFKNNYHNKRLNETLRKGPVNESAQLRLYEVSDKYIPYVEMVNNPGEMFDLQKFGKTQGYIKTPITVLSQITDSGVSSAYNYITKYKAKQSEVQIFDAASFVHGCLDNTNQRQPETIDIFLDAYLKDPDRIKDGDEEINDHEAIMADAGLTTSFDIKRGQSILFNSFKVWRELNLLEMSALLNRLTKSSIIRVLNIDIGDMGPEEVQVYLQRIKEKIEQKAAVAAGQGMSEYTAAGPMENTIYVPVHEGKGAINTTVIGGDFDPKSLVDLEYFRDKLFGSLKIPKQFFGFTEDGAGFNGGTSLTILSSRYGKSIKNIQNIICQMVTDLLNLFLIDRNLDNYVNKFRVRMQEPITQEELDRRANNDTRLRYIGDIMQQLSDIEDPIIKLKIYKSLLSNTINDPEVMKYIQEYVEDLEAAQEEGGGEDDSDLGGEADFDNDFDINVTSSPAPAGPAPHALQAPEMPQATETSEASFENTEAAPEMSLPSPANLAGFEAPQEGLDKRDEDKEIINEDGDNEKLPSPADFSDVDWLK